MKNYYDILGVDENDSQDKIKKSYRKLSKQYHPDVNPDGDKKFKEIAEAYDTLGDENKRMEYNHKKNNPFMGNMSGGFDVHSIFEEMVNSARKQTSKVQDKIIKIEITPIESYNGVQKNLNYDYLVSCRPCNGNGGEKTICNECKGHGYVMKRMGTGMFQQIFNMSCHICGGNGSIITNKCNTCEGHGMVKEKEILLVSIPKNVDNGDFLKIPTKGDYGKMTNNRGDLLLKIELIKKDNFDKIGKDLVYSLKLNVLEILIEKKIKLPHPDGDLIITMPKNLNSDNPFRLFKKGYKDANGIGDFYVKLIITNDYELDEEIKNNLKNLLKEVV